MKTASVAKPTGFTLTEMLVVIAIMAIVAALALPAVTTVQKKGLASKSLANLRQWGVGLLAYLSDSNQELPYEGAEENPTWAQVASAANERAWYNVIPPYVDMPGMKDLTAAQRAQMYHRGNPNILQCPLARWNGNEATLNGPRFSYAFNSKLFGSGNPSKIFVYHLTDYQSNNVNRRVVGPSTVAMLLGARASTKEPKLMPGMNNDTGTPLAYTRRASARTGGKVPIVFFDGSVRSFVPREIMDNNGRNINTSPVIWNPWNPDEP